MIFCSPSHSWFLHLNALFPLLSLVELSFPLFLLLTHFFLFQDRIWKYGVSWSPELHYRFSRRGAPAERVGEGRSVAGPPWVGQAPGQSTGWWKNKVYVCMYNVYLHVQSHLIFCTTLYILLLGPFNRWGRRGTEHVNIYSNIGRAVEHVVHAGLRIPSCVLFLAPCPRSPSTLTEKRHQLLGSQGSLASRSDASPFSDELSEKGWSPIMWKVVSKASLGSYWRGGYLLYCNVTVILNQQEGISNNI